MRVNVEQVVFNIFKAMDYMEETDTYFAINLIEQAVSEV